MVEGHCISGLVLRPMRPFVAFALVLQLKLFALIVTMEHTVHHVSKSFMAKVRRDDIGHDRTSSLKHPLEALVAPRVILRFPLSFACCASEGLQWKSVRNAPTLIAIHVMSVCMYKRTTRTRSKSVAALLPKVLAEQVATLSRRHQLPPLMEMEEGQWLREMKRQ